MKAKIKNLLALAVIFTSTSASATILTVDNNIDAPDNTYPTFVEAHDAASPDDSIYIIGSYDSYNNIIIEKKLHIFGAGYNSNKPISVKSEIQFLTIQRRESPDGFGGINVFDASGSTLQGLEVNAIRLGVQGTSNRLSNIIIKRCYIKGELELNRFINQITLYNNYIERIKNGASLAVNAHLINIDNIVIRNNIIASSTFLNHPTNTAVTFVNNNFIRNGGNISPISNAIISNNIFYGYSPFASGHTNVNFSNNISFGSSNNDIATLFPNSGTGNLVGVNPLFVSKPTSTYSETEDDLNLQVTSPAKNAGTDGTDIGIYGGAYPWPEGGFSLSGYMYSQEADIPQTNQMEIQNVSVPTNGTLNVSTKGITNH